MICCLKIIFIGILSLFISKDMPEQTSSGLEMNACIENSLSSNIENTSSIGPSQACRIIRTIEHLLKSSHTDIPVTACLSQAGSKDTDSLRHCLRLTEDTLKSRITGSKLQTSPKNSPDVHGVMTQPKDYYVLTLERIII